MPNYNSRDNCDEYQGNSSGYPIHPGNCPPPSNRQNNTNVANNFPTANNPPYGFNDNNFNRQKFPSNVYPEHGARNQLTGNPLGRFNPVTTNTLHQMNQNSMSNFDKSYEKHDPIIEKINYTNQREVLHNNIAEDVLDEHITEYRINIDSLDRDIKVYPDPFCFTVKFNPPSSSTLRTESYQNGKFTAINDFFSGPPKPHIGKEFRNVKYVKLENVVLPQFSDIIEEDVSDNETPDSEDSLAYNSNFKLDPDSFLVDDRFVALAIKELDINRTCSTVDDSVRLDTETGKLITPPKPFGLIFPDKLLGRVYYLGTPFYASTIYDNSDLGNLKQLTIQFYDSCGTPLKFNNLFTFDELVRAEQAGHPIPMSNIRHPLNKRIQVHLSFVIGVVESQINKLTKFELS